MCHIQLISRLMLVLLDRWVLVHLGDVLGCCVELQQLHKESRLMPLQHWLHCFHLLGE